MFCEFEHLYFSDEGYVVRCARCKHYQIAFGTTLLSLNENEFVAFQKIVAGKIYNNDCKLTGIYKSIVIQLPVSNVCMILTPGEAKKFYAMLDEADSEIKTTALLKMFH